MIIGKMLSAGMDPDEIAQMAGKYLASLGPLKDEFMELINLFHGDDEAFMDVFEKAKGYAYTESIDDALDILAKIEDMQELIDKLQKNGLDKDNIDTMRKLLGLDFGEIYDQVMEDAENFDVAGVIEFVREKMAEAQGELDENWAGSLLGLPSEDQISDAISKLTKSKDIDGFMDVWNGLSEKVKEVILENYEDIGDIIANAEAEAEQSGEKLGDTLDKIKRDADISARVKKGELWGDMADVLDDIAKGGDDVNKAFADVQSRVDSAAMAMAALQQAANGDSEALDYLAKLTGLTAASLGEDLTAAEYAAQEASLQAGNSVAYLANMLYMAGAIEIDPSGKISAIGSIEAAAAAAGMTVAQFAAALTSMDGAYFKLNQTPDGNGMFVTASVKPVTWNATKAASTSGKRSGGGGGGGGGGGSMKVSEGVTNLLENIEARKSIGDYRRELAQLAQSYYTATGELQGVILYLGIERDIVEENTKTLQNYMGEIEAEIEKNKDIIATHKEGSKEYQQAMMDLEKLQEDHQKYSKELAQNKVDVVNLTKAIMISSIICKEPVSMISSVAKKAVRLNTYLVCNMKYSRIRNGLRKSKVRLKRKKFIMTIFILYTKHLWR